MTDSWSLQVSDLVDYMSSTAHSDPHFSNLVADYILWVISFQVNRYRYVHFDPQTDDMS